MVTLLIFVVTAIVVLDIVFTLHSIQRSMKRMEQLAEWQANLGIKKMK